MQQISCGLFKKFILASSFTPGVLGSEELELQFFLFFLLPSLIGFCSAHCLYFTTALVIFRVHFLLGEG